MSQEYESKSIPEMARGAIIRHSEGIRADIEAAEGALHDADPGTAATLRAAHSLIVALENEVARAKRERDGIEQEFRDYVKSWWEDDTRFPCHFCKHEDSGGNCKWRAENKTDCIGKGFEWRGPQEGEHDGN